MSEDLLDIEHIEIPENAVVVIYDRERAFEVDSILEDFASEFHTRFQNLVVVLSGDSTFETMPLDQLEALLKDLIAHKQPDPAPPI